MQKLEEICPGKTYKIVHRGNNDEPLFFEKANNFYFLELVKKHVSPVGDVLNCRLFQTRVELTVKIKTEEQIPPRFAGKLFVPFSNLFNSYAKSINKRYNRNGSLFKRRFERTEISFEQPNYEKTKYSIK